MGPRPDGRGRFAFGVVERVAVQRQWGRDRMAAEGDVRPDIQGVGDERQWGRDRMAAEGYSRQSFATRFEKASMGPRPDGRGRLFVAVLRPLIP